MAYVYGIKKSARLSMKEIDRILGGTVPDNETRQKPIRKSVAARSEAEKAQRAAEIRKRNGLD